MLFYRFFCPLFYVFHFFHYFIYLLNIFNLSFVFSTFYVSDLLFLFCFSVFSFCSIYLCIICLGSFSLCRLFLFSLSLSFISVLLSRLFPTVYESCNTFGSNATGSCPVQTRSTSKC